MEPVQKHNHGNGSNETLKTVVLMFSEWTKNNNEKSTNSIHK